MKNFLMPLFILFFLFDHKAIKADGTKDNKVFIVNASSLILREQPNKFSNQLTKLFSGRSVYLIEITDIEESIEGITAKWYKISTKDNKEGFVFSGFLKEPESCQNAHKYQIKDDLVQHYKKGTGNYWDGYDELDQNNLKKYKFASRINDVLIIKLNNNKTLTYKDNNPTDIKEEINFKKYYLREYIEKINYCIVSEALYEGDNQYFINLRSGATINLWSVPVLPSPNNKFMLVLSNNIAYGNAGIQIIKNNDYQPSIAFEKKITWFQSLTGKWLNDSEAEIITHQYGNGCYICKVHVVNNNGVWKLEE